MGTRKTDPPKNSWLGHELLQRSLPDRLALCGPLTAGFLWPGRGGEPPHVTIRDVPEEYVEKFEKLFEELVPYHDRAVKAIRSLSPQARAALSIDDLVTLMGGSDTDPERTELLYGLGLYLHARSRYPVLRPRPAETAKRLRALCAPIGGYCRVTPEGLRFPEIGTIPVEFPRESDRELYEVIIWPRWVEQTFRIVLVSPRPALEDPEQVQPTTGHKVVKLGVTFSKRQEALFLELVRYHRLAFNRAVDKLRALKAAGQPYRLSPQTMFKWTTHAHAELGPDVAALKARYGVQPARSELKQLSVAVEHHKKIPEHRDLTLTDPVISVGYLDHDSWKLIWSANRQPKLYLQGFAQGPARKFVQSQGNIRVRGGPDALATLQAYRATSMKIVGWGTKLGRKYELQLLVEIDQPPPGPVPADAPVVAIDRNVDSWGVAVQKPGDEPWAGKIRRKRLDDRKIRRLRSRSDRAGNVGDQKRADRLRHRYVVANRRRSETAKSISHQVARGFVVGFSDPTLTVLRTMCGFRIPSSLRAELRNRPAAVVIEKLDAASMKRRGRKNNLGLRSTLSRFSRFGADTLAFRIRASSVGQHLSMVDARWSSQTCSRCGVISTDSRRTQSDFACVRCGSSFDAEANAALNLLARTGSDMRRHRPGAQPAVT